MLTLYNFKYSYMVESKPPSVNCICILQGYNGLKDTVCHWTMKDLFDILPSTTIAHLLFGDELEPYYTIRGYIDLNKFKMIPIEPGEKSKYIEPHQNYIIGVGKVNVKIAKSYDGVKGGFFTNQFVNSYLPTYTEEAAKTIFAKHEQMKKKMQEIESDFE